MPNRTIPTLLAGPARAATPVLAVMLALGLLAGTGAAALAQVSATGPEGQALAVSKVAGLSADGETVSVTGSGYDQHKGIYVAYCVDNGPGAVPTPCGGGADTSGSLGASHWISSDPPSYGEGLAVPYGDGGSFAVTLAVTPTIQDVDCTVRACAVVTRADHTRSADRTQDVRVPVSFATGTSGGNSGSSGDGTSGGGATGGGSSGSGTGTAGDTTGGATGSGPAAPRAGDGGVITAGPVPEGTPAAVTDQLAVTRVSADDSAGRWWLVSTGGLLALLLALLVTGRLIRRRAARRAGPHPAEPGAAR